MVESFTLVGTFLSITHSNLYQAGHRAFLEVEKHPGTVKEGDAMLDILKFLTTLFSAYSIISNHMMPFHHYNYSQPQPYDIMAIVGCYPGACLVFGNLDLEMQYDSGTMIALLGKLLRHGVTPSDGNRVCIAFYMRDNVHERMGVESPGWMTVSRYGGEL